MVVGRIARRLPSNRKLRRPSLLEKHIAAFSSQSNVDRDISLFLDTTQWKERAFLPIHFYKTSSPSESEVLEEVESLQMDYSFHGVILPTPQFPRDFRNAKCLAEATSKDFKVFLPCQRIEDVHATNPCTAIVPFDTFGSSHGPIIDRISDSSIHFHIEWTELDTTDTDRVAHVLMERPNGTLWISSNTLKVKKDSTRLLDFCTALYDINSELMSSMTVSLNSADGMKNIEALLHLGVRGFAVHGADDAKNVRSTAQRMY